MTSILLAADECEVDLSELDTIELSSADLLPLEDHDVVALLLELDPFTQARTPLHRTRWETGGVGGVWP